MQASGTALVNRTNCAIVKVRAVVRELSSSFKEIFITRKWTLKKNYRHAEY